MSEYILKESDGKFPFIQLSLTGLREGGQINKRNLLSDGYCYNFLARAPNLIQEKIKIKP